MDLLDVDGPIGVRDPHEKFRRRARDAGESWAKRRDRCIRAVTMAAKRTRQPLVRATIYPTLPTRTGALLEQPVRVLSTEFEGVRYVWCSSEDMPRTAPAK